MLPFPSRIRQFAALFGSLTRFWTLAGSLAWPLAAQDFQTSYDLAKNPGTSLDAPAILAHGKLPGDGFGRVIRTGDVNGDGVEDLIVGSATASAGTTRHNAGTVCIWFGSGQIGGVFDAASSVGRAPDVTLLGARAGDSLTSGGALTVADVNGDGIADLLLGAPGADGPSASRDGAGESYIVFGRDIFPNVLDLAVQGDGGADVTLHGASEGDSLTSGGALSAGDVNGDGITDLLLGALAADGPDESRPSAGEAYVIFGREEFPFTLDLGIQGPGGADVTLYGADEGDFLAYDGALKAADVNADGIPDIILGAVGADGPDESREAAGECYIVFGRPGLPPVLDLKISGPGNADVTLYGVSPDDQMTSGGSIFVADVNGDGINDLLLGTPGGDGPNDTRTGAGETYIVFGRPFFPPVMDLAFQGHGGADVTLYGASAEDSLTSGGALAAADVDKDGIADILLGAGLADGPEESRLSAGEAYIVLGRPVFPITLDLAIQGPGGADVTLYGASPGDNLAIGGALLAADVNQDGRADLILGALLADGPEEGRSNAGEACVILGRDAFAPVLDLAIQGPGGADITLYGATPNDQLTRERSLAAGDINGDGVPDILLGARDADGPGEARGGAGEVTVILGNGIPFTGPQITLHQPAGTYLADGGGRYFGAVLLNNIGTRLFTVVNTGTEPLTGIAITLGGVNEDDYSVDRAALPAELDPGQSGAFLVTFAPGTLGLRAAAMQIHSSDTSRSPYDVRLTGIGAAPELSVEQPAGSPRHTGSTRAFGGVATGYSKTLVFVLKNIGTADLEGVIPSLTGADAARFSFPAPASSTIAPGQSLSLPVTFTPGVLGDFSASLHVISSVSPDAPYVVHLTGSGVPPAPELDLEQPAHTALESGGARAYGSVSIGASKNLVFTLRNTGTAALTGIALSTEGENPADFLPLSPTLPDVPAGGSATFTLAFAPQARGARAAQLRIASDDADENPYVVHLSGTGVDPRIQIEHPFGTRMANGESRSLPLTIMGEQSSITFTLRSTGSDDLTGISLTQTGAHSSDFILLAPGQTSLPPAADTIFSVIFTPKAAGTRATTLRIASNDADDNPFLIPLTATGAAPKLSLESAPAPPFVPGATLVFDPLLAGTASPVRTLTVRNTGTAPLTGLAVTLSGSHPGDFIRTLPALTALQPGASTTFTLTFQPVFAGSKSATLTISSPTPGATPFQISLSGAALPLYPLYSSAPASRLLVTGQPHTLEAPITGAGPFTHRWRKNGKDLKDTTPTLPFKSVRASDAAIYSHFVTNTFGSLGSGDIWVAVANRAPAALQVKKGATLTLNCIVKAPPGAVPAYEWLREGAPVQPGAGITGLGTKKLKITPAQPAQSGVYTCRVTLATPAGEIIGTHGDTQVHIVEPPELQPLALADAWVSQPIPDLPVPCLHTAARFTATGLPPGVKLHPATGILSGKPTAPRYLKGALIPYQVQITASNIAGKDTSPPIPWTIRPLDAALPGHYTGTLDRHDGANSGLGGTLTLTLTSSGAFTGKVVLGGLALSFKDSLNVPEGGGHPGLDLLIPRKKPLPPLRLTATLSLDSLTLAGALAIQAAAPPAEPGTPAAPLHGWKTTPATLPALYNTALIPPASAYDDPTTLPQGDGWAAVKVTAKAAATWAGRLADGSTFTHAGSLGPGGQTSLHALFHQKTGSLHGRALLTPESISGIECGWFIAPPAKPRATGSYRQGIPLHSLSLHGGPWQPPAPGHTQLILLGGGLTGEAEIPFEITPALKTRVGAHPLALQITGFKPATGQWSGHFTLDGRKAPLHGLLLPGGTGHGHFLLPQAPAPGEKNLPSWSGRARIGP